MAAKQEFASRFAKHKDELEWLFMELYHNREGLEVLEREMAEAYNARSAELKALDKARSADPDWYKRGKMFGMTMYTDLFALCRKFERTGKEAALPQGAEADLSAPDACCRCPTPTTTAAMQWRISTP